MIVVNFGIIRLLPIHMDATIIKISTRDYLKDITEIVNAAVSRNTEGCVKGYSVGIHSLYRRTE